MMKISSGLAGDDKCCGVVQSSTLSKIQCLI